MKITYYLLCFLIISCQCETTTFFINGQIDGVKEGAAILLKLDLKTNEKIYLDTVEISNGTFTFNGSLVHPYLHTIYINDEKNVIHLFLDKGVTNIKGTIMDLEKVQVDGSREDLLFRNYALDDIFDRSIGLDIMIDKSDYTFAAFTAYYQFQIHHFSRDTLEMIMNGFSEEVKHSEYYKHLNSLFTTLIDVAIGSDAPGFSVPDTAGVMRKLDEFLGDYVLLDFWASWCVPCRESNPHLVAIYSQYYNRGFKIIGISMDTNKDNWVTAIREDDLEWINLSSLQGWDKASHDYGVKAVPQNFLLDPEGKIIAKNLEPSQLAAQLKEIYGESLQ